MKLRKKINLKGVLLALAISMPPLISTIVFIVQKQPLNNQSITLFDHAKTFTSLSEPYNEVSQDSSIVNDDLTQTVPFKVSISYIKPFKLVSYRTRSEIETKIHDLIVLNTRQELIELNKDYEINFITNTAPNEVVPIQTVKVKATTNSEYLMGEFSFQIVGRLKLAKNRASYENPIAQSFNDELFAKNVLKEEIHQEMINQNIDESTDDVLGLLNIVPTNIANGSTLFKLKHDGEYYYDKIVFQFLPNKLFSSDLIIWNNIVAPNYTSSEIPGVSVNQAYSLSFVDNTNDREYPHAYDWNSYVNSNHIPSYRELQWSPTISFAKIDVKKMFNIDNVSDFFKWYEVVFEFQYKLNIWMSNGRGYDEWGISGGKNIPFKLEKIYFSSVGGLQFYYGGDRGISSYAEVYISVMIESTIIEISGFAASAYDKVKYDFDFLMPWHAAFALLKGNSLKIIKK